MLAVKDMCQLLGMNCATLQTLPFLSWFFQRAGVTSDHCDGFGIAFLKIRPVVYFVDNQSAVESPIADLIRNYPIKSRNVICTYPKKQLRGKITLGKFTSVLRELWGRHWILHIMAILILTHNSVVDRFEPVGNTDSERAFCYLLKVNKYLLPKPLEIPFTHCTISSVGIHLNSRH